MKIQITQNHIKRGKKGRVTLCPIALALKERGFEKVRVRAEAVEIDGAKFSLSPNEMRFIKRFDNGEPVEPFVFRVRFAQ